MNVNLYGCRGQWIMVDLGLTFADPSYPGIELILPELEFIEKQQERLAGIVLTHGHEDHIGALPYLAEELKAPLFATPFTAGLIAGKLEEEGLTGQVKLNIVERGGSIELGPFRVSFVALSHSIPEGNGVLIETPFGNVFHTGDWKIDETPVIGEAPSTDVARPRSATRACSRWCAIPPTSSRTQPSGSEESVHAGLLAKVAEAKGACSSPPSRPTPRACRRSAASRAKPAARCASPAGRSTASCASRRRLVICRISRRRSASTKRCGCRAAKC